MEGVHPDLIAVATRAITLTKIDFGIPQYGGVRSVEDQHQLFLKGVSKADGFDKLSKHQLRRGQQYGRALDFYAIDPTTGKASWDHGLLFHVACAMLQAAIDLGVDIQWGGLFRTWKYPGDGAHIELKENE
jgi:peptidoglycan L-alanyl-D-glutamate endopeptidase CwlK